MSKKNTNYAEELAHFTSYVGSSKNEDAKRPLLYPLFKKLYKEKFKIESEAHGADVYAEGILVVESKTNESQWLEGFFQALHYRRKFGLAYHTIMVVAYRFCAIWKLKQLPENVVIFAQTADSQKAPNVVGKENAKKANLELRNEIKETACYWLCGKDFEKTEHSGGKSLIIEGYEILKILHHLDSDRLQINRHNFIHTIERMKPFFASAIEAIHTFYAMVGYWDITSTLSESEHQEYRIVGFNGRRMSDALPILPKYIREFRKFVENQYIFTNEGSGFTVDYYFSRFDEVLAQIDPAYVKQHGIFFTDANLSQFALWFVDMFYAENIKENFVVFDPAGGSGNLVSSWRGKLKHKIVSELQPDLLKIIDRRMKADPFHIETGFTIIPRIADNQGLNFLAHSAKEYLGIIQKELDRKHFILDKPLAFLLNPPYKNTDENEDIRQEKEAEYSISPDIVALTGEDAVKERYLAFLGQILNIAKIQAEKESTRATCVLIFTPTSWLIPRNTYTDFKRIWDRYFAYETGFIVNSNAFFKLEGKWPLAFTVWRYRSEKEQKAMKVENVIKVKDFTHFKFSDLDINWLADKEEINTLLSTLCQSSKIITLDNKKGDIRTHLPHIDGKPQSMYDFKRDATKEEKKSNQLYGGLPLKDDRRKNKKTYGIAQGIHIGFMDNCTPVRIKPKNDIRFQYQPHQTIWFLLPNAFLHLNYTRVHNGAPDKYGYCAYDLASAQALCSFFALTKAMNGKYPLWANQYNIWQPSIPKDRENYFYALCFAFVLAENRCVVTQFEANNPIKDTPEIFVGNPLCPTNPESFWATTLDKEVDTKFSLANTLTQKIKELYQYWNLQYCKGQFLQHVGLENEPYFVYFDYPDFLTPYSGLLQIRKYAQQENAIDLLSFFEQIDALSKQVKEEIYCFLVEECAYF